MEDKKFELCFVKDNKAWFTSNWKNQWGDDWNDAPYEHNAGEPYSSYYDNGEEYPIELKVVYFEFPDEQVWLPCTAFLNSPYTVEQINKGAIAWIRTNSVAIPARTTLEDFIEMVEKNGGNIYLQRTSNSNED